MRVKRRESGGGGKLTASSEGVKRIDGSWSGEMRAGISLGGMIGFALFGEAEGLKV